MFWTLFATRVKLFEFLGISTIMVSWSGSHNFFRWRHLRHFTIWIILAKPWNRKIAVLIAVPVSEKILAFFRHLVSLFITSPLILAYFVWLFGKNFPETEKKLKYFGARMFWINFVPRIPSSRRCVLIKVIFSALYDIWKELSWENLPFLSVFGRFPSCLRFFFMKENRRAFSEWMESLTLL